MLFSAINAILLEYLPYLALMVSMMLWGWNLWQSQSGARNIPLFQTLKPSIRLYWHARGKAALVCFIATLAVTSILSIYHLAWGGAEGGLAFIRWSMAHGDTSLPGMERCFCYGLL